MPWFGRQWQRTLTEANGVFMALIGHRAPHNGDVRRLAAAMHMDQAGA